jgi:hypothetical protein
MQIKNPPEPSLDAPPVYRCFLAGGPEVLRLSTPGAWLIIGLGVLTAAVSMVFTESRQPGLALSSGCAATIAALATAAVAARWLGGRAGVFAGCFYLLSGRILLETGSAGGHWFAAMATAAVGVFALGTVAGRLPPVAGRWPAVVFYGLVAAICIFIGSMAAGGVVLTCVAFAAIGQSGRGLRFLVDWRGLAVLTAVVAMAASTVWPQPQWPSVYIFSAGAWPDLAAGFRHLLVVDIPIDLLPWGPLALVAIAVGIRQGHHTAPFGRLLTVWVASPLVLTPLGLLDRAMAAALVFTPLVILCGLGLCEVLSKTARSISTTRGH